MSAGVATEVQYQMSDVGQKFGIWHFLFATRHFLCAFEPLRLGVKIHLAECTVTQSRKGRKVA